MPVFRLPLRKIRPTCGNALGTRSRHELRIVTFTGRSERVEDGRVSHVPRTGS